MSDVFISYAREDQAKAEAMAKCLYKHGWEVWWDRTLVAGENFSERISRELESARCIVVIWSKNSIDAQWVLDEAAVGRDKTVLVPCRIDDTLPPLGFRQIHTLDLSTWRQETDAPFAKLLEAIQRNLRKEDEQSKWSAILIKKGFFNRTLRLYLSHGSHIVDFERQFEFGIVGIQPVRIKVDGEVVFQGRCIGIGDGMRFYETYVFDGKARYPLTITCKDKNEVLFSSRTEGFELFVDGWNLYSELDA